MAGLVCVGAAVADQTYTPETTMGAKNEEPVDWDHSNVLTVLSSIVYPPGLDLLMHYRYFDLRCMTGDVHMTTIMVQRDKPIRSKTHVHRTLTSGVEDISEER